MALSIDPVPAGYSLLQLEAGLSRSSLATVSASGDSSSDHEVPQEDDMILATVSQPLGRLASAIERPLPVGMPSVPPQNFGLVVPGVYRSSYPQAQDFVFLQGLKLKTIITLVRKEIPAGYQSFLDENGVRHLIFDMAGTKKADIPLDMMQSIIGLVLDKTNHPMLVHCNQGKHRTGCVVGILRRYHGWDTASVLDEYERFAYPKVRPTDVHYLREFQLANLNHAVAQRLEQSEQTLHVSHFVGLYMILVLGLLIWILIAYGVMALPLLAPPRPPKKAKEF